MLDQSSLWIDVKSIVGFGILIFMSGCGVAEGPAYLRVEGTVVDEAGTLLQRQEVTIQVKPEFLNQTQQVEEVSEPVRTDAEGKFSRENSHWTGGLLIIPLAMLVAPISGLVAAVTPWTFRDVNKFFSPVYLFGSTCLPHPTEIAVTVGDQEDATVFDKEAIREKLYRGEDSANGKGCTRVYNVGVLKTNVDAPHIAR